MPRKGKPRPKGPRPCRNIRKSSAVHLIQEVRRLREEVALLRSQVASLPLSPAGRSSWNPGQPVLWTQSWPSRHPAPWIGDDAPAHRSA
jgi:hypothetical protein